MSTMPTEIADPSLWSSLGPAGGILAFIVTGIWLFREYQLNARLKEKDDQLGSFNQESKIWREAIGKQWRDVEAANRQMYTQLLSLSERVATALEGLKVYLEGRLR